MPGLAGQYLVGVTLNEQVRAWGHMGSHGATWGHAQRAGARVGSHGVTWCHAQRAGARSGGGRSRGVAWSRVGSHGSRGVTRVAWGHTGR
eukprot:5821542-Prymnesium_polylepis.2